MLLRASRANAAARLVAKLLKMRHFSGSKSAMTRVGKDRGVGLLERKPVPPRHGHEVAEPHVGQLVQDHLCDALQLLHRGIRLVHEQSRGAVRDEPGILRRLRSEVGDRDHVDLVPSEKGNTSTRSYHSTPYRARLRA